MAFKIEGKFYSHISYMPGEGRLLGPELIDIRPGGFGRWMWCKDCNRNVLPVASFEHFMGEAYSQALCSVCGRGLTSPELRAGEFDPSLVAPEPCDPPEKPLAHRATAVLFQLVASKDPKDKESLDALVDAVKRNDEQLVLELVNALEKDREKS